MILGVFLEKYSQQEKIYKKNSKKSVRKKQNNLENNFQIDTNQPVIHNFTLAEFIADPVAAIEASSPYT